MINYLKMARLSRCLHANLVKHEGSLCLCQACRAGLIFSLAADLEIMGREGTEGGKGKTDPVDDDAAWMLFFAAGMIAELRDNGHEEFKSAFSDGVADAVRYTSGQEGVI